ncbi:class I SAM-dependent methyltransferase [Halobaculum rubrum]|uniref:class I SAM-dependent methyltransferase n=1 Tax=Halobaculum rubrum TaxID=2872158 RepID=UPI001CA3D26E|nr:class I SAM-dependent methyltransferase [Halobaculum rubrum]QZX99903.1 class I SAM-dependent methyltransferase [Halobaculum rubrum]
MSSRNFLDEAVGAFREAGVAAGVEVLFDNLVLWRAVRWYNRFVGAAYAPPTDDDRYRAVESRAREPTDFSDHLHHLYTESLKQNPATIVEVGVRGGESTFVFERVAERCNADLVSVDLDDCSNVSDYEEWHFVQANGVEFGAEFPSWADENGVGREIDVLFIDTTHEFAETLGEIDAWFPNLAERATVFFHDTNLTKLYRRSDGTIGLAWNNERAVIRALESRFDAEFDESSEFSTVQSNYVIEHDPLCNGLTTVHRLPD